MYHEYMYKKEIKDFKKFSIFKNVYSGRIEILYKYLSKVTLSKDNIIYKKGSEAVYMYFIK